MRNRTLHLMERRARHHVPMVSEHPVGFGLAGLVALLLVVGASFMILPELRRYFRIMRM